ncbi:MAG: methylenetetrahydromethanopterin dehydrogenase [Fuerstiella sp.]|nr:methylenetetrahydromethanopterin dehydrogenase [Fuerstiella sp.]
MQKILIQLDTDDQPAAFDQVVAVDAGADRILSYGGINENNVEALVHGAIFTRGPADLNNTAIFVGGSNVAAGEQLAQRVAQTFFGPMRVSLMMDSNGCNTTAAAAVVAAKKHLELRGTTALVLGGTGPVGQRVAQLLAGECCKVRLASRSKERAAAACNRIVEGHKVERPEPVAASTTKESLAAAKDVDLLFAAGAAGVCFLSDGCLASIDSLKVAVDLNAVPPTGVSEIEATDKAVDRNGVLCYGALGVGAGKMQVHKQAVRQLFQTNDRKFGTEEIYHLALEMAGLQR